MKSVIEYANTKKAFTLSEVLIVLVMLGIIALLTIGISKTSSVNTKGFTTLAQKTIEHIELSIDSMIMNDSNSDDLTSIKDNDGYFSLVSEGSEERFFNMLKKYMVGLRTQPDLTDVYFSDKLSDNQGDTLDINAGDTYSEFFYLQNGTLMGIKLYGACDAEEVNSYFPYQIGRYTTRGICGSIYMDVNGLKGPNKLGTDQYIIPLYAKGLAYTDK